MLRDRPGEVGDGPGRRLAIGVTLVREGAHNNAMPLTGVGCRRGGSSPAGRGGVIIIPQDVAGRLRDMWFPHGGARFEHARVRRNTSRGRFRYGE